MQDAGQFVEGTALQGRRDEAPVVAAFPVNAFKLVLDVKHPHAQAAGDNQDCQLDQHIRLDAEHQAQRDGHRQKSRVHRVNGMSFPRTGLG